LETIKSFKFKLDVDKGLNSFNNFELLNQQKRQFISFFKTYTGIDL
jgi:hypothetical protein